MGDTYKSMGEELRPIFEKTRDELGQWIYTYIRPRQPIIVWGRQEDALELADLRHVSMYSPYSLRNGR